MSGARHVSKGKNMKSSQHPHSGSSTTPKPNGSPHPQFQSHAPSENIFRPGVRSHTTTQIWLDSGPNTPPHGDSIHHHRHIEANFFESRNLLCDSIQFLVQSHLTTQQAVDSNKSPLQHTNPNYLDTVSTVTRISKFKPSGWRSAYIHIHSTTSVRYKYASFSVAFLILRAHTTPHWQFLLASPLPLRQQFPFAGPSLPTTSFYVRRS